MSALPKEDSDWKLSERARARPRRASRQGHNVVGRAIADKCIANGRGAVASDDRRQLFGIVSGGEQQCANQLLSWHTPVTLSIQELR
jgi:hypothetical protein